MFKVASVHSHSCEAQFWEHAMLDYSVVWVRKESDEVYEEYKTYLIGNALVPSFKFNTLMLFN